MTTLDTAVTFAKRVEDAAAKREPIDWRRVLIATFAMLPYMLGRLAGRFVYGVRIMASAALEGYREGAQPQTRAPRRPMVATAAQTTVDG